MPETVKLQRSNANPDMASSTTKTPATQTTPGNRKTPVQPRTRDGIFVIDAGTMDWEATGKDGLALKTVRDDQSKGHFLGAVGFEPLMRSGLHQHQGVASSYFVRGGITDYSGSSRLRDVGINLKGATHDAIAYDTTLLISKLEGPVTYPEDSGQLHHLHSGAHHGSVINERPDQPPNIYVPTDSMPAFDTGVVGVNRQMLFDYSGVGDNHRMVLWSLAPGSDVPAFQTTAPLEFWVEAGDLSINKAVAHANCFAIMEPGTTVRISSRFGARVFVWIEGPAQPAELPNPDLLFGY